MAKPTRRRRRNPNWFFLFVLAQQPKPGGAFLRSGNSKPLCLGCSESAGYRARRMIVKLLVTAFCSVALLGTPRALTTSALAESSTPTCSKCVCQKRCCVDPSVPVSDPLSVPLPPSFSNEGVSLGPIGSVALFNLPEIVATTPPSRFSASTARTVPALFQRYCRLLL